MYKHALKIQARASTISPPPACSVCVCHFSVVSSTFGRGHTFPSACSTLGHSKHADSILCFPAGRTSVDFVAEDIDSVVLRHCLEGLCEVIDPVASAQDKEVTVSQSSALCRSTVVSVLHEKV